LNYSLTRGINGFTDSWVNSFLIKKIANSVDPFFRQTAVQTAEFIKNKT